MAAAYGGSVVAMAAAAAPTSSAHCNQHSALVGFQNPPSSSSSSSPNSVRLPSLAPLLSQCRWLSSSRTSREEQQPIVGKRSWVLFNKAKARCTETSRVVPVAAIVCLQSGSQNEESKERRERVVEGEQQQQQQDTSVRFDVSSNCVNPSFRVSPFLQRSLVST